MTACDRGNGELAALADPLNPAVLELIARTVAHGEEDGRRGQPVRRHGGGPALRAGVARLRPRGAFRRASGARAPQGGDRRPWREARPKRDAPADAVADYKAILKAVLESRPSGMRQRLAEAIGKNRSFVSQISNPSYQVPIPARHVVAHLRDLPLLAARAGGISQGLFAGPSGPARRRGRRPARAQDHPRAAGSRQPSKNQELETLIFDFVHRLTLLLGEGR